MSTRSAFLDPAIQQYVRGVSVREPAILRELRDETSRMPNSDMQIGPDQGHFMRLLAALVGARRYLEIGVFTGYSSLALALELPDDGRVVACDVSQEYTAVARRYWQRAGVASKIDLRIAPAAQTLGVLATEEPFDMAFIDADKESYDAYYEGCLRVLRSNGVMLIDNVLWSGAVADPGDDDPQTRVLRALNAKIGKDERVDAALLPIGDGLTVVRKR